MSNCSQNIVYRHDVPFNISVLKTILFCMGTIIGSLIYLAKHRNSIYFHPNFRVIFNAYIISFIVRGVTLGFCQMKLLYIYQTEEDLCKMGMDKRECFALMYPTFVSLLFMGFMQLCMAFERAISLYYSASYYTCNSTLGIVLTPSACILSLGLMLHLMWIFPISDGIGIACSRGTLFQNFGEYTGNHIFTVFLMSTELISLVIIVIVACTAFRKHRLLNDDRFHLSLAEKFEKARNINVLNGILPLFLMHSLFSLTSQIAEFMVEQNKQSLTSIEIATYVSFANLTSLFTLLAPIVLLKLQKRKYTNVARNVVSEDYFITYKKQWQ